MTITNALNLPISGIGGTLTIGANISGSAGSVTTNANLTGPVTSSGNTTTIANNAVTFGNIQQISPNKLLGNPTGSTANLSEINLGSGLSFTGSTLNAVNNGTITTVTAGTGLTGGGSTGNVTVSLSSPVSAALGGTGVVNSSGNTITLGGTISTAANLIHAGAFSTTITATGITNATLPSGSNTLATTTGSNATGTWPISITGNSATTTTIPSLSGDVNSTGNSVNINSNAVTYAKFQQVSTAKLLGNPTGSTANVSEIILGSGFSFTGNTLNYAGGGGGSGTVTNIATGLGLTGGPITSTGTISMLGTLPSSIQLNITQLGTITTGVWNGSIILPSYGGSGVNNGSFTSTLGGNLSTASSLTHAGAFATTITVSGITNSTLPSGTKTLASNDGTNATGTWPISVTGNSATVTTIPTLTGDVTNTGNSVNINTNAVTYAKIQQVSANKILGNPTATTGNTSEITLGTGLSFSGSTLNGSLGTITAVTASNGLTGGGTSGSVNVSLVNLTGDVTSLANATTIAPNTVSYAKFQQSTASTLLGNPTGTTANIQPITLGTGLSFSGTTLNATSGGTGTVTSITFNSPLTGGTITTSGTVSLGIVPLSLGGTNSNLTASAGALTYSDASSLQLLAAPALQSRMLLSGTAGTPPSWTTFSFPNAVQTGKLLKGGSGNVLYTTVSYADSYAQYDIPYASAANSITALSTVASSVLTTQTTGQQAYVTLSNNQVVLGVTGGNPTATTLTAGSNITFDQSTTPGSLIINSTGGGGGIGTIIDSGVQTQSTPFSGNLCSITLTPGTWLINGYIAVNYNVPSAQGIGSWNSQRISFVNSSSQSVGSQSWSWSPSIASVLLNGNYVGYSTGSISFPFVVTNSGTYYLAVNIIGVGATQKPTVAGDLTAIQIV